MKMKIVSDKAREIGHSLALMKANVLRVTAKTVTVNADEEQVSALIAIGFVPTDERVAFGKSPMNGDKLALYAVQSAFNGLKEFSGKGAI